jgi:integrase
LQKGSLTLRSGSWWVRYRTGTDRRMVSHRLGPKDDVLYGRSSGKLRQLLEDHMAKVNAEAEPPSEDELTIEKFWSDTYLPFIEANKKHSTIHSYRQIWGQHLQKHFGQRTLAEYRTSDAYKFLNGLADSKLGRNAIQHVRSLMSGIFSAAANRGLVAVNPVRECKIENKMKPPKPAEAYSLREVEDLVTALKDRPDMQLLVTLQAHLGLRPSECQGLAWDCVDLDAGEIHLRRGVVRNVVQDLKTPGSVATLPIIEPVGGLLRLLSGKKFDGQVWVFENGRGKPACLKAFVWQVVRPAIANWNESHGPERRIKWRGMYGLRRTAATSMWNLTGGTEASQLLLRHTKPTTVNKHYLVADRSKLVIGLKLLEAHVTKPKD